MMHRKVAGKLLGHFVSCPTLSIWRPIPWAKVAHLGDMYWTYLGYILTTFWLLSGYTSCYTWATFRLHSGYILLIFRPILTIFWLHSDYMLTKFWLQSDYILTTFFQPFPYLGIIPKKMCFFTVSLNLICINLGCGNYSWYTLPEIEHGRLCIVWNYIYSCI